MWCGLNCWQKKCHLGDSSLHSTQGKQACTRRQKESHSRVKKDVEKGALTMKNVTAAVRLLGSGFFQEYTGLRRDRNAKNMITWHYMLMMKVKMSMRHT
jgi:hypothetical protein